MNDYLRESFSYFGMFKEMSQVKKIIKPEKVSFETDKNQYYYFYEPVSRVSDKVIVWIHGGGWSAGAHLSSILTYSKSVQKEYDVDVSNVIGYVGWGGPYCFNEKASLTLKLLLNQLFSKKYDRKSAESVSLLSESKIPMLLIQSRHDGIIDFSFAEAMRDKAEKL